MVDWACAASLGAGMPSGDLTAGNTVSVGEGRNAGEATERNTGGVDIVGRREWLDIRLVGAVVRPGEGQEENSFFDSMISLLRPMCLDSRTGRII